MSDASPPTRGLSAKQQALLAELLEKEGLEAGGSGDGPIERRPDPGSPAPLSCSQERLWVLEQLLESSPVYNVPAPVHLQGPLDTAALERAWREVLARHELLRACFEGTEEGLFQHTREELGCVLEVRDETETSEPERWERVLRLANEEFRRPFELSTGPLVRATLWKLDDEDHLLLVSMHHMISDGVTIGILFDELRLLYAREVGKPFEALEEPALQHADFAHWQRGWLETDEVQNQLDFWTERLADPPEPLALPHDRPRGAEQTFAGAWLTRTLDRELLDGCRRLADASGATIFQVLLAAFHALLHRTCGQNDLAVGIPVATRKKTELERLPGFFVNTLVVRAQAERELPFRDFLEHVRDRALEAYDHQDAPFERVVEAVQPERNLATTPLFQAMFDHRRNLTRSLQLAGLRSGRFLDETEVHSATTKVDLAMYTEERDGELIAALEFNTDLFDEDTARRFLEHYEVLLSHAVADPQTRLDDLKILTDAECEWVVEGANRTDEPYPDTATVHSIFERWAEDTPAAVACVFGGREVTYGELNSRANRLAQRLVELDVRPGDPVALCVERSDELLVSLLGILKAGGAYLPLDPEYPDERLHFMLSDSGTRVLVSQEELAARLPTTDLFTVLVDAEAEELAEQPDEAPGVEVDPRGPAYVIYTSGSTGRPKGVPCPHRGVLRLILGGDWLVLDESVRIVHLAPISFDASVLDIWGGLLVGGTVVPYPGRRPDLEELRSEIRDHGINSLFLTTALFNAIVDEAPEMLESVRQVATGGEAMSLAHVRRAQELLPELRISNCYGPTEGTVIATCWVVPRPLDESVHVCPIGTPTANTRAYVLDDRLRPVPIGSPGELCIGGPGIASGYLNREELTAERFVEDPFRPDEGTRLYRTGDLVRRRNDGQLEFLGRNDDQVKIRGHRIEPGEIESCISSSEQVRQCLVLPRRKNGEVKLIAYLVVEPGSSLIADDIVGYASDHLPEYMVPQAFCVLEELPMTAGGKIDRARLPEPDLGDDEDAEVAPPRNELERLLCAQWADVLQKPRVGIHEDFFALGGHSLAATVLIARFKRMLDVALPLATFFKARTVEGLAAAIEAERDSRSRPLPPIEESGVEGPEHPLSFNQYGLYYLQRLAPESPFYNVPVTMEIYGALDRKAFDRALVELLERHEPLRTTYTVVEGEAVQRIGAVSDFSIEELDFRGREEMELVGAVVSTVEAFGRTPLDLESGPVFRALLIRTSETEQTLAINVHHIAFDGWSMDLLVEELGSLYTAFAQGEPSPLEKLPVTYSDYARWQRRHMQGERWESELEFWRSELAGAPPVLELPTDRPRPLVKSWRGKSVRHALDRALVPRLRALASEEGVTPYMMLLAGAQTVLSRYGRTRDFVVGTPVSGRTRPEIENAIGLFLNIVAIRCDLTGSPTFRELLQRTRERTLTAYAHQDFPFEALVEALSPERDLSMTPIYQVLFSLRAEKKTFASGGVIFESPKEIHTETAKTDLAITIDDDDRNLIIDLTYDAELFDVDTIRSFACHFENLLTHAVSDPDLQVERLEMLDAVERHDLLDRWSGPVVPYPREESVACLFYRQVERTPEAVAVVLEDQELTYAELNERSNQLAYHLIENGVSPGDRVTLSLERSLDMVVSILAILKAGAAYVPLDPAYPSERLSFMVQDTASPVLLVHSSLLSELPPFPGRVIEVDRRDAEIAQHPLADLEQLAHGDSLAYVMYTSGSTGRPKGVSVLHRSISRLVFESNHATLGPDCIMLQLGPIAFDASTLELWGPLLHGGKLVLYPDRLPTPERLEQVLREHEVTTLWLTAALFNAVVDERPEALASVRECLTGGEALSVPHIRKAYAALPPTARLINGYGPTENTTFTCCHPIPRDLPEDAPSIPIGKPITNTKVYVVDEHDQLVPPGVPGELLTGGDGLARGYLERPRLTAERFVDNPFGTGKLYRTGDLVRWLPDGTLEFLGRNDDQVKIRGHRIELGEIQTHLTDHDAVQKAHVAVHEDATAGKRLVAYVEPKAGKELKSSELASHLAARLPEYMVPASINFVAEMPVNANGKVDRSALPEPGFESLTGEFVAPLSEVEVHLAELWKRILRVDEVSVHDDFFELGGHSLMAVKLVKDIKDVFGIDLPLSSLIGAPTLFEQGQLLHQGVGSSEANALVKIQPKGELTPVFCVCSLGGTVLNQRPLAVRLGDDQPFYGLQAVDLDQKLGRSASIQDYAEHYIEIIKHVQPNGPYVIGGHSFGGIVSYEIAQQLTRAGDEVAMLFILDSALPNLDAGLMDRLGSVLAFLRGLPQVPAEAWKQFRRDPEQFRRDLRQKLRLVGGKLGSRFRKTADDPAASPAEASDDEIFRRNSGLQTQDIVEMSHWPENNRRIAERHYRAVLAYEPTPYPGRVNLFRSRFQSPFLGLGFQMGWDRVARKGVEIDAVPGGHLSVLQEPHVQVLAAAMKRRLEQRGRSRAA